MTGTTVVTGAGGQLGIELARRLDGQQAVTLNRSQLDITDARLVERTLAEISPRLIIHAAAATNVDGCEHDRAKAYRTNAVGDMERGTRRRAGRRADGVREHELRL